MRVTVDTENCDSHGVCVGICPEVFEIRDDDYMYIINENPPEELRPKLEQAVKMCPKQALTLEG